MDIQSFIETLKNKSKIEFEVQQHSHKRVYIRVSRENVKKLAQIIFRDLKAKFSIASGLHIREGFEVLYHFTFDKDQFICTLRTLAPHDDPKLDTLTSIIPGALWIEREIYDILGVKFTGHPNLKRLVKAEHLAENEFPFRKDFDINKFKEKHGLLPDNSTEKSLPQ
jgi:NADH:ubiquinone oxidoreductase subunit C